MERSALAGCSRRYNCINHLVPDITMGQQANAAACVHSNLQGVSFNDHTGTTSDYWPFFNWFVLFPGASPVILL